MVQEIFATETVAAVVAAVAAAAAAAAAIEAIVLTVVITTTKITPFFQMGATKIMQAGMCNQEA